MYPAMEVMQKNYTFFAVEEKGAKERAGTK